MNIRDGDYLHALIRGAVSDPGKYSERRELHRGWDGTTAMESLSEWQTRAVQGALREAEVGAPHGRRMRRMRDILRRHAVVSVLAAGLLGGTAGAAAVNWTQPDHAVCIVVNSDGNPAPASCANPNSYEVYDGK